MSTLQELARYCREESHLGVLLLTGEWGCGKTYLIEKELAEELQDTHFIVRVSLMGADSIAAMNAAVRQQWLLICTPLLGKLKQDGEQLKTKTGLISAIGSIMSAFNPLAGRVASAVVAVDPLEYIPLEPVVEDFRNKGTEKHVVLIFDDLDRSKIDLSELLGTVNEYCENKHFRTIVIANEEVLREKFNGGSGDADSMSYRMLREKTISRTVYYQPDHQAVIHRILTESHWSSPEYTAFLAENEALIYDAFAAGPSRLKDRKGKFHNLRSLKCALKDFGRFYEVLVREGAKHPEQYLYSFIAYMIAMRNGICKDDKVCLNLTDDDIKATYSDYRPELLPESIRRWVNFGFWEESVISQELSALCEQEKKAGESGCPANGGLDTEGSESV